jgi:WD40 repeat protein
MSTALLVLQIRPDPVCIVNQSGPHGHSLPVTSIAFNADASLAATCSNDSLVKLWQLRRDGSATCLSTLTGHSNPVCDVAFSPCGGLLASSSMNAKIMLWVLSNNGASCTCKSWLQYHTEAVFCVAFSPRAGLLAAGSGDTRISLIRYCQDGSAQFMHELLGHSSWVLSLAFHPSGLQLCSGSKDASIRCAVCMVQASSDVTFFCRLWALSDGCSFGQCIATLNSHTQAVYSVAYSPTGTTFASGSKDKSVKLWGVTREERGDELPVCTCTLLHHAATVWAVAFSPNGMQLASSAGDGNIQLWSLRADGSASLSSSLTSQGHSNSAIAFNPRGRQLISSSGDADLIVYM